MTTMDDARTQLEQRPLRGVVIGGSAGSVEVLNQIIPALPADISVPVLIVVHLPPERANLLPGLFQPRTRLEVREAIDKEPLRPGRVLFAPADYHLLVERDDSVSLSVDAPVHFSRPAIDVLFESAAWAWGSDLLAIVLTGANEDGAAGLAAAGNAGGIVWVQSPGTAYASAMPAAALQRFPAARVMTIDDMVAALPALPTGARRDEV